VSDPKADVDYGFRAKVIMRMITAAGGTAGKREIWLRANRAQENALTISQIDRMLRMMLDRGHISKMNSDPATYALTTLGQEWMGKHRPRRRK